MDGIIYKYTNKVNGKVYIGQTIHEKERYYNHKNCYDDSVFHRAIKKYGFENFDYEVIERLNQNLLNEREIFWISYYNSTDTKCGYNITQGGEGNRGRKLSEEHKLALITSRIGKHNSDEHNRKISQANKGRTLSKEQVQKLINSRKGKEPWNKGKHLSNEVKEKIRNTLKGRPLSEETKQKMRESKSNKYNKNKLLEL